MKLKACLITLVVAEKSSGSENPEAKRWGDDPVNDDACLYTEKNGIARVTTVPGLGAMTKCYKLFRCDDGTKVQMRLNQFRSILIFYSQRRLYGFLPLDRSSLQ